MDTIRTLPDMRRGNGHAPSVAVVVSLEDQRTASVSAVDAIARVRVLFPPDATWTVVSVLPPHPITTTGTTGFASPILTIDETDAIAHEDERQGAELTAAIAHALHDPTIDQWMIHADRLPELGTALQQASADVVVTPTWSTDSSSWSRALADDVVDLAPCPLLVVPEAALDAARLRRPALRRPARVLIAVDDSTLDRRVIDRTTAVFGSPDPAADDLCADTDTPEIVVAHVEEARRTVRTLPLATLLAPVTDGQSVARATERLDDAGARAESVAEDVAAAADLDDSTAVGTIGSIADGILSLADDHDVDVIAVGTHDRSWLSRLVRPSVSGAVEERSRRPVLVVRAERPADQRPVD